MFVFGNKYDYVAHRGTICLINGDYADSASDGDAR